MANYHFGRGRSRWAPYLLLLPGFFFYLLIMFGPSLATSVYSFTDATGIRGASVSWIGLENYREFLLMGQASRDNYDALVRTLIFMVGVTTIQCEPEVEGYQLLPHTLLHACDLGCGDTRLDLVTLSLSSGRPNGPAL